MSSTETHNTSFESPTSVPVSNHISLGAPLQVDSTSPSPSIPITPTPQQDTTTATNINNKMSTGSSPALAREATLSRTSVVSEDHTRAATPAADSPNRTLTDLNNANKEGKQDSELPSQSTMGKVEAELEKAGKVPHHASTVLSSLPQAKKNILTLIFCVAMFIDAAGVSATFLMTEPIAKDLNIGVNDEAWILGTYSMIFAAFLLFAGRLADLYPPHRVFTIGFMGLGILYLIISFMTNEYAFFVLRAVSALLAVWTIPSAINMIVQMFPDPAEQAKRLALFGMAGALANTIALVLAGIFLLASWRWYFRFITILVIPFSVFAWFLLPRTEAVAEELPGAEKWKRMDLGGVGILCAMLILFILGFTQAPINGWSSAIFLAPFLISIALVPTFIIWEQKMPRGYSLLPKDIWSFPNIFPLILQASSIFMWFATAQLRIATFYQVSGNSAILTAVKLLPMGITALVVGTISQMVPTLITRPRFVQPIASALCFVGSMLFAFSDGGLGSNYWKYTFIGEIIGTAGGMLVFIGMNTNIIQAFPLEFAGVGGSFAQIIFQIGGVIGIAVQQGLLSTGNGTIQDWTGSKNGYFFTSAYIMATGLIFVLWYRQAKMPERDEEAAPAAAI